MAFKVCASILKALISELLPYKHTSYV